MNIKLALAAGALSLTATTVLASEPLKERSYGSFNFNGQLTIPYSEYASTIRYVDALNLTGDYETDSDYTPGPWESKLPNEADSGLSEFEKSLTAAYLDDVNNIELARYLAIYHLSDHLQEEEMSIESIKRNILAQYYLSRVIDLSSQPVVWAEKARSIIAEKLHNHVFDSGELNTEDADSHGEFLNSFNHVESNRYQAIDALFTDFIEEPNNAMTVAYLTASNIWAGGEANYDDPVILQSFVFSSYFARLSLLMGEELEKRWDADPENNERLRLASILGGWSIPARRWLAVLHGDDQAIETLDQEHDIWLEHNAAFHSISIGLMFFNEPENLLAGWEAWFSGFTHCQEVAGLRSCPDRPRFSFNQIAFTLGAVDYLIKLGDFDTANMFLSWKFAPFLSYDAWDMGQKPWDYRMTNMAEMSELFNNDNPDDDPVNFLAKEHKWGPDTITCQSCHQVQSREWSEFDKSFILPPHESVASLGDWPDMTTSWLSSSQETSENCTDTATWDEQMVYDRDDTVVYRAGKYRAKWWAKGTDPVSSGQWGAWEFVASCSTGLY